jgi:D-isomer specific 2-hydroxyacid dehydrogenase, catalytic domain
VDPIDVIAPRIRPICRSWQRSWRPTGFTISIGHRTAPRFLVPPADRVCDVATSSGEVDTDLIVPPPRLEIIAAMGIGLTHVDLAAAKARGIHVTNTSDSTCSRMNCAPEAMTRLDNVVLTPAV